MSKETISLPKTSFSMKANLPNKEPSIVEKWKKINLYEKLRKSSKGKKKFILHDGPPYANGDLHLGHALNKILKDIICRAKFLNKFERRYNTLLRPLNIFFWWTIG